MRNSSTVDVVSIAALFPESWFGFLSSVKVEVHADVSGTCRVVWRPVHANTSAQPKLLVTLHLARLTFLTAFVANTCCARMSAGLNRRLVACFRHSVHKWTRKFLPPDWCRRQTCSQRGFTKRMGGKLGHFVSKVNGIKSFPAPTNPFALTGGGSSGPTNNPFGPTQPARIPMNQLATNNAASAGFSQVSHSPTVSFDDTSAFGDPVQILVPNLGGAFRRCLRTGGAAHSSPLCRGTHHSCVRQKFVLHCWNIFRHHRRARCCLRRWCHLEARAARRSSSRPDTIRSFEDLALLHIFTVSSHSGSQTTASSQLFGNSDWSTQKKTELLTIKKARGINLGLENLPTEWSCRLWSERFTGEAFVIYGWRFFVRILCLFVFVWVLIQIILCRVSQEGLFRCDTCWRETIFRKSPWLVLTQTSSASKLLKLVKYHSKVVGCILQPVPRSFERNDHCVDQFWELACNSWSSRCTEGTNDQSACAFCRKFENM